MSSRYSNRLGIFWSDVNCELLLLKTIVEELMAGCCGAARGVIRLIGNILFDVTDESADDSDDVEVEASELSRFGAGPSLAEGAWGRCDELVFLVNLWGWRWPEFVVYRVDSVDGLVIWDLRRDFSEFGLSSLALGGVFSATVATSFSLEDFGNVLVHTGDKA